MKRIKKGDLMPWFLEDHGQLPQWYLDDTEKFFKWLEKKTNKRASERARGEGGPEGHELIKK
jgi:hypothetical protein